MLTDIQVINLGLSKIAASSIRQLDPPRTELENFLRNRYQPWKEAELCLHPWVFAREDNYQLTLNETVEGDRPYKFLIPIDCLRVLREADTEWKQRGRYIASGYDNLKISYIRNVPEAEWDALFVSVMAWRVAYESAEYVTQSSTKRDAMLAGYKEALADAKKANAFIEGPQDVADNDYEFSWLSDRYG